MSNRQQDCSTDSGTQGSHGDGKDIVVLSNMSIVPLHVVIV